MRPALRSSRSERRRETPGSQHAGGHRIRVTPVPIPNTEVKPDTADGTARETVWESRSLPALFTWARSSKDGRAFCHVPSPRRAVTHSFRRHFGADKPTEEAIYSAADWRESQSRHKPCHPTPLATDT